jgi:copper transport protein
MPEPASTVIRLVRRSALATAIAVGLLTVMAPPAAAHVDLAASDPADGSVLDTPVDAVELIFTESAQPAGDGVLIITETDDQVAVTVSQVDDTTIQITPVEPLASGRFAVGWTVQAGDAHPRSGAITFTVTAAAPASGDAETSTTASGDTVTSPPISAEESSDATEDDTNPPGVLPDSFASLTEGPDTIGADWLGRIARGFGLGGALLGIGALIFAATVPVASGREAAYIGYRVRRGGLAVLVSLPLELIAQSALLNNGSFVDGASISSLATTLGGPFGWAMLLRTLGAAGLLWGTDVATTSITSLEGLPSHPRHSRHTADTVVAARAQHRLDLTRSPLAVAGAVALLVAFVFDGHTVIASPAWLVRITNVMHVAAGATWAGGVVMLAAILTRRHRSGVPARAGEMVLRFSAIASVALATVGIAGIILAWAILDSAGELFSTPWGRVLIAKLSAVGAAAAIGAYNHFAVIPRISEDEEAASELIRRTSRTEGATLLAVVVLTAVLVGAAS